MRSIRWCCAVGQSAQWQSVESSFHVDQLKLKAGERLTRLNRVAIRKDDQIGYVRDCHCFLVEKIWRNMRGNRHNDKGASRLLGKNTQSWYILGLIAFCENAADLIADALIRCIDK